jgi:hypothetical protein
MFDPIMTELDALVREHQRAGRFNLILTQLFDTLQRSPELPQAWQPLPNEFFNRKLPGGVESGWIFALRGGGKFPNERHPNSWQRSIAIRGVALFETYENDGWVKRPISGAGETVAQRSVSIPENVWHRIAIGPETFVSLSFHTVPANDLIEETCVGDDFSKTSRRLYQEH